jgi:hypothetical protein
MLKFLSKKEADQAQTGPESKEQDLRGLRLKFSDGLTFHADLRFFILLMLFSLFYTLAGETASEWIYLITAGTLGLILLGVVVPLLQIIDTDASIYIPGESQAEERLPIQLVVSHAFLRRTWGEILPLRWIRFKTNLIKQDKRLTEGFVEPCVVIHAGKRESLTTVTEPLKRGFYKFDSLEAATCFPFAVIWWSRKLPAALLQKSLMADAGMLTVYPRLVPMRARFMKTIGAGSNAVGHLHERNRASQESTAVRSLREYRIGDSPRWVHWPSTARCNRILVKEFESESSPQYLVTLDTRAPWQTDDQFELAVCLAYSIVHCQAPGTNFDLLVPPADELKDVYGLPVGLARSREILARLQREIEFYPVYDPDESLEEASFRRLEQLFKQTLRQHSGSVLFAILPGSGPTAVNLIEATLDNYGRPLKRPGRSQRHHALSPELATGQHKLLNPKELGSSSRGQIIARVSQIEQIALL